MAAEIINRRLKRIPNWAATHRLLNLKRSGVASKVVIDHHARKEVAPPEKAWAEIHIITTPEKKEVVLSLIKSLRL